MSSPDAGNLRRKTVRMLGEGAVLHALPERAGYGALADATPDAFSAHRVYRYGLAFPVGLAPAAVEDQAQGGAL